MSLPKYTKTNSQERSGVNAAAEAMAKIGQIWRETPLADVGIDGQIEYVSPEGRKQASCRVMESVPKLGLPILMQANSQK